MFGSGRDAKRPKILSTRAITKDDLSRVVGKGRGEVHTIKQLRDSHHLVARLLAMGHREGRVAEMVGYSLQRVSTLKASPAFRDLIEQYRSVVDESFATETDEYFRLMVGNRIKSARLISDKLDEAEPADYSLRELAAVHADAADRTGYPKRTVALNVNVDFAAQLDRAVQRSSAVKTITHQPSEDAGSPQTISRLPSSGGENRGGEAPPERIRRIG